MMQMHKSAMSVLGDRLRELGFKSYREYLASEHWRELRKRWCDSKLNRGRCYGCESRVRPLQLHHKTYNRLGRERLNDLVAMCSECHTATHNLLKESNSSRVNIWNCAKRTKRTRR